MILFLEDWKRYPRAIPDTKTPNKTFLDLAAMYRQMGVKNYYFHLALLQPELQGVNPHADNLPVEVQAKILYEIDNNPWYYLREIVLNTAGGLTLDDQRYRANRANIAAMWLLCSSIDYAQVQPRQTGKSFGTDANSLWLLYFKYRKTTMNLITKDEKLRKENVARLKRIRDGWPDYVNRNTKYDDNNQMSLSCNALENKFYVHVGQTSEKAANNLGRGMTAPYVQTDEGPFINHIETTISAAMGSMNDARHAARRKGYPTCAIFTTTAGNKETRDGRYMYELVHSGAPWDECLYDCKNREELVKMVLANGRSRAPLVNLTMSHRQLGLPDSWLYEAIANARGGGSNIDRDYFNSWGAGDDNGILKPDVAAKVRASEMDPIDKWISKENYIFKLYEDIDPGNHYILTCDTSNAIGRDDIAVTLVNVKTGGVAGAGTFNETNLMLFAAWLLEAMLKYRNSTLIIENKQNAQVIIDYLILTLPQHGEDPVKRIYSEVVQDKSTREKDYNRLTSGGINRASHQIDQYRRDFGFPTDATRRKFLYSNVIQNAARDSGGLIRDRTLISQIMNLGEKNGRIDHGSDGNDDLVISWLLGQWFLIYGKNKSHYGINSAEVLSEIVGSSKERSPEEILFDEQQKAIEANIKRIQEELSNADDRMTIARLEAELEALMLRYRRKDREGLTFDAIVQEAAEARRMRQRTAGGGGGGHAKLRGFINAGRRF